MENGIAATMGKGGKNYLNGPEKQKAVWTCISSKLFGDLKYNITGEAYACQRK